MLKESIELAQLLSTLCLEQYTKTYYQVVEKIYTCLKDRNMLYIYVSPKRRGIAQDFQTKLYNAQKNVKLPYLISVCEFPTQITQHAQTEDIILFLDENKEVIDFAKENNVYTMNMSEHSLKANIEYNIPSVNFDRVSEAQYTLLNSISDNCIKFLS